MPFHLLLILGSLTAFGPLAVDFYLPSFPLLAQTYGTDVEHVQLTLASYFIGLMLGQLIFGPLADRFGRRPPLLVGVAIFALASLGCALAPTLEWLIFARFVQALGGCAGMVLGRAVVRDVCDPTAGARAFSQLMLVMGLAPILAPPLGALLLKTLGWQSIFYCLTVFAVLCWIAVALWLPETLPEKPGRQPLTGIVGRYVRLFKDREFMAYSLAGGVAMAGMFAYIGGSPFVYIQLYGVDPGTYGWLFGINAAGFILFAQLNARLLKRRGPGFWVRRMIWLYALGGVLLLSMAALHTASLWFVAIPLFVCISSLGCVIPNASACALAHQAHQAGVASALMGSLQFAIAALANLLIGVLHDGSAVPMALVICLCALVSATLAWYAGEVEYR